MKINKESLVIKDIPLNLFYPDNLINRPLIFFVHGYFNNKEEGTPLARVLVTKGFVVICLDAFMHGDRLDKRLTNARDDDDLYIMFDIVEKTAQDIDILIDYFKDDKRIDINKIGMTGYSMGAFTTFLVLSRQPLIKVAVPIIGLPSFVEFWNDYVNEYQDKEIKKLIQQKDTPLFRNYLYKIDPINKLTKLSNIPLLILNGKYDESVNYSYSLSLYEALINNYENKELLKFSLYETKHEVTAKMFNETISWFVNYLK